MWGNNSSSQAPARSAPASTSSGTITTPRRIRSAVLSDRPAASDHDSWPSSAIDGSTSDNLASTKAYAMRMAMPAGPSWAATQRTGTLTEITAITQTAWKTRVFAARFKISMVPVELRATAMIPAVAASSQATPLTRA
jgi:hypothetical protein